MNNTLEQTGEINDSTVSRENMAVTDDVPKQIEQVAVSLDVVWHGTSGKYDARMSEISLEGCFIDSMGQEDCGRERSDFKVHLPAGPWVTLRGIVTNQESR
jgi:hypothetical protein